VNTGTKNYEKDVLFKIKIAGLGFKYPTTTESTETTTKFWIGLFSASEEILAS